MAFQVGNGFFDATYTLQEVIDLFYGRTAAGYDCKRVRR